MMQSNNHRTRSLDVFRGLTVALMILVNNPGSWKHIYAPFDHAQWHGYTLTDLVFPFFLFAVGNAMSLVIPKLKDAGSKIYTSKILKRTVIIFLIGLFLNWNPFVIWRGEELILKTWTWLDIHDELQGIRIFGVLQRIALAYGLAGAILYFFEKRVLTLAFLLLILSTAMGAWFGSPIDPWSLEGFYGTAIDRLFLGPVHMYHGDGVAFDPEGLMSTISAVSQILFGFWAGQKVIAFNQIHQRKLNALIKMAMTGLSLLIIGYIWSLYQPINKKIWTSSYTLVTSGWAFLLLIFLDWKLITSKVLEAFGRNPLFIFVLSGFIPRCLALIRISEGLNPDGTVHYITPFNWFYENVCALVPGHPNNGSLFYAILVVSLYGWLAITLDRKRIYIRV